MEIINENVVNVWFRETRIEIIYNCLNFLIDNFHRFVSYFQYILWILITWLQVASLEAGSRPNFPVVTLNEDIEEEEKMMGTSSELQNGQVYV